MPSTISVEPRQGIRLSLASCFKIRSYQGGGEFWELQNQQVIRQALGDFLPRADESEGSVLYSHFVDGREVCSESNPAGGSVPKAELARLQSAVAALKAKENDQLTDPNAKKLIAAFRLPDPTKDPEFYRVYGTKWNSKLLVLWGVEKEQGSALIPQTALAKLPPQTSGGSLLNLWPWLLGLMGLMLVGWLAWDQLIKPANESGALDGNAADPAASSLAGTAGSSGRAPERAAESPSGDVFVLFPRESSNAPGQPSTPSSDARHEPNQDARSPGTAPLASNDARRSKQPAPDGSNRELGERSSGPGAIGRSDAAPPASTANNPKPGATPARDAHTASTPATPPSQDLSRSTPAPGTQSKPGATPAPNQTVGTLPKPGENGARPEQFAARSTPPPSRSQDRAERPIPPSGNETPPPSPDLQPSSPMKDGAPSAASPVPAAPNSSLPNTRVANGPVALEITNSRTAGAPRDGKIEVMLNAVARDKNGSFASLAEVTEWRIDGKPHTVNGKPVTTTLLPLQLGKGAHRVSVTGKGVDGRPIRAEADVDVNIQVQESGNVQIKPRPVSGRQR